MSDGAGGMDNQPKESIYQEKKGLPNDVYGRAERGMENQCAASPFEPLSISFPVRNRKGHIVFAAARRDERMMLMVF